MRVLYLSNGNIPSKWAHTFQVMKMAEALRRGGRAVRAGDRARSAGPARSSGSTCAAGTASRRRCASCGCRSRCACAATASVHAGTRASTARRASTRAGAVPDLVYTRSLGAAWRCAPHGLATVLECHLGRRRRSSRLLRELARLPGLRALRHRQRDAARGLDRGGDPRARRSASGPTPWTSSASRSCRPAAARARLGIGARGPLVVYCGHFYPEKGVDALAAAAPRVPKATVLLVGGWPDDVARLRAARAVAENVRIAGFVPNRRCRPTSRPPTCWCCRTPRASRRRAPPRRSSSSTTRRSRCSRSSSSRRPRRAGRG